MQRYSIHNVSVGRISSALFRDASNSRDMTCTRCSIIDILLFKITTPHHLDKYFIYVALSCLPRYSLKGKQLIIPSMYVNLKY